jgi:alpha-1,3-rhamnosyl/mannosyltransferase
MRVVVNLLATLGRKTGVGHYTGQLLRCLLDQAPDDQIDGFPTGSIRRVCRAFIRARARLDRQGTGRRKQKKDSFPDQLRSQAFQFLRRNGRALVARHFQSLCTRQKYDLYHEPNFIPFPCDRPTVTTLHDLSVLLHPEWHPPDRVRYHEQNFSRSLAACVHFLAVSEFTRREVIQTLNIRPERVTRTYNGVRPGLGPRPADEVAAGLARLGLPSQYLLYLGTIEPRKNVLLLLKAYCSLPELLRRRWPLLLVGNWGWNAAEVAGYFEAEAKHCGVLHLGYIREKYLAIIYNGARALVYPSRYEGFGLPPVEMMACGGAVLASSAGALVETVGPRAQLIHPDDFDGWRQALRRVIQDDAWWKSLRMGARAQVQPFTWEQCAADTLAVYRSLAGASSKPLRPALLTDSPPRRAAG